jgi:DNA-binding MarR family transcriptional regulator
LNQAKVDVDFRLDDHIFFHFSQILARRTRALNAGLKPHGLDYPRWRVLAVLHEHSGASMGRLADLTSADRTTLTHTLRLMEAEGLIARRERLDDRRSLEVSMTLKGQRLFAKILPLALAETNRALAGFSRHDTEILRDGLRRMAENLRE